MTKQGAARVRRLKRGASSRELRQLPSDSAGPFGFSSCRRTTYLTASLRLQCAYIPPKFMSANLRLFPPTIRAGFWASPGNEPTSQRISISGLLFTVPVEEANPIILALIHLL